MRWSEKEGRGAGLGLKSWLEKLLKSTSKSFRLKVLVCSGNVFIRPLSISTALQRREDFYSREIKMYPQSLEQGYRREQDWTKT